MGRLKGLNVFTHVEEDVEGAEANWTKFFRISDVLGALRTTFLPAGFPESVTDDYLEFQVYDTVQAACSYFRGILVTAAVLEGIGVGSAEASPLGAALEWVVRDGCGMLASLLFGWAFARRVDADARFFRLLADVLNDFALSLELCVPLWASNRQQVLIALCIASVAKAIVGSSAGCARAALTAHFCLQGNQADVAAKEGTQETAVTLIGMIGGGWVASQIGGDRTKTWAAFLFLTAVHVWANYRAVCALRVKRLNAGRTEAILEAFLKEKKTISMTEANKRESLWPLSKWGVDESSPLAPLVKLFQYRSVRFYPGAPPSEIEITLQSSSCFVLPGKPTNSRPRSILSNQQLLELYLRDCEAAILVQTTLPLRILIVFAAPTSNQTAPIDPQLCFSSYISAAIARDTLERDPTSLDPSKIQATTKQVLQSYNPSSSTDWNWSSAAFPDAGWRILLEN